MANKKFSKNYHPNFKDLKPIWDARKENLRMGRAKDTAGHWSH